MDIYENKASWDTNVNRTASLLYHEIITGRDSVFRQRFNNYEATNRTIRWIIDGSQYDKDQKYDVTIKSVFNATQLDNVNSNHGDACISQPENDLASNYTSSWACHYSNESHPSLIGIYKVCNGIIECVEDKSDEEYLVCKPPDDLFQNLATWRNPSVFALSL